MALLFRYSREAEQFGPFTAAEMRKLAAAGTILATDLVWQDGTDNKVVENRGKKATPRAELSASRVNPCGGQVRKSFQLRGLYSRRAVGAESPRLSGIVYATSGPQRVI